MTPQRKQYLLAHREERNALQLKWSQAHREQSNTIKLKSQRAHPNTHERSVSNYRSSHREELNKKSKTYLKTLPGKLTTKKAKARRKNLGFIPLNECFPESEGHHVNTQQVIFIPRKLHTDIRHSILQNRNMEKINKLSYIFLLLQLLQSQIKQSSYLVEKA